MKRRVICSGSGELDFFVFEVLYAGLLGLLLGSFVNMCIDRLPLQFWDDLRQRVMENPKLDESVRSLLSDSRFTIAHPRRSFCFSCGKMIPWYDNLPVLSYLLLKGRCRFCDTEYGSRSALVEAWHGVSYGVAAVFLGLSLDLALFALHCSLATLYTVVFFEQKKVPHFLHFWTLLLLAGAWTFFFLI